MCHASNVLLLVRIVTVRESVQKCNDIVGLLLGKTKITQFVTIDIHANFRGRPGADISGIVKHNDLPQVFENAVMQIRSCFGYIS